MKEYTAADIIDFIENVHLSNRFEEFINRFSNNAPNITINGDEANKLISYCHDIIVDKNLDDFDISTTSADDADSLMKLAAINVGINVVLRFVPDNEAEDVDLFVMREYISTYFNDPVRECFTTFHNFNSLVDDHG